jgi:hypothetical protein
LGLGLKADNHAPAIWDPNPIPSDYTSFRNTDSLPPSVVYNAWILQFWWIERINGGK